MMIPKVLKQENPWDVSNIQEFLYYNCPECDTKERDSEVFIQHALDNHELSKSYLNNPHDQDDITESHSVKSETDFSDSEFKESSINDASSLPDSKLQEMAQPKYQKSLYECSNCQEGIIGKAKFLLHQDMCQRSSDSQNSRQIKVEESETGTKSLGKKCPKCGKFFHPAGYSRHIKVCGGETEEQKGTKRVVKKCPKCGKSVHPGGYSRHIKICEEDTVAKFKEPKKCVLCDKQFVFKRKYMTHFDTDHKVNDKYTCDKCDFAHCKRDNLKVHIKVHGDPVICDICGNSYNTVASLQEHKKAIHNNWKTIPETLRVKKCDTCDITFTDPSELNSHFIKVHNSSEAIFGCEMCGETWVSHLALELHFITAHQMVRYCCDKCDKAFNQKSLLKQHYAYNHREEETKLPCEVCGKLFSLKQDLRVHLRNVHHIWTRIPDNMKTKNCDKCDNTKFTNPMELNQHLISVHNDEKDFQCKECHKTWVSHLSLELHMVIDHKMVMYCCGKCGYYVNSAATLKRHHKWVHEEKFDYVCHICAKALRRPNELAHHLAKEHGEGKSKYQCSECGKILGTMSQLKEHLANVHYKEGKFPCDKCDLVYNTKLSLKKHSDRIHLRKKKK